LRRRRRRRRRLRPGESLVENIQVNQYPAQHVPSAGDCVQRMDPAIGDSVFGGRLHRRGGVC
jgi:hypothetical protein